MSAALEAAWADVIAGLGSASIDALVGVLDRCGDLDALKDRLLAEAGDELRADAPARPRGKRGEAVALIRAGATKEAVVAATSRRTYFRARQDCQKCQITPARSGT